MLNVGVVLQLREFSFLVICWCLEETSPGFINPFLRRVKTFIRSLNLRLLCLCIYELLPVHLVLLVDSSGPPQATPPTVLSGHPGPQEVLVGAPPAILVLAVELSLQLQGESSILTLLLDLTDVPFVQGLLAHRAAPLEVWIPARVQVFGLLFPLLAPPWGSLVMDATVGLLPRTLWVLWH